MEKVDWIIIGIALIIVIAGLVLARPISRMINEELEERTNDRQF